MKEGNKQNYNILRERKIVHERMKCSTRNVHYFKTDEKLP